MTSGPPEYLNQIHRATGMLSVQVGCEVDKALDRLRILAAASHETLYETALRVIAHTIELDS
jgi:hypothetical protein